MTNPLVSIIVPVYNAQKGLSRCLGKHLQPDLSGAGDHRAE